MTCPGRLTVISGPSGCGKNTLIARLMQSFPEYRFPVSATTRKPRVGEKNGIHYHFLSVEEFERRAAAGEFLERACVFDKHYGTLRSAVLGPIETGQQLIKDIDVQGAETLMKALPPSMLRTVFVAPPSLIELEIRLRGRATDSDEIIRRRLGEAEHELSLQHLFDRVVVNGQLEQAHRDFTAAVREG